MSDPHVFLAQPQFTKISVGCFLLDSFSIFHILKKVIEYLAHPLPGEMNISQLQGKIEFNTFLF